MLTTTTIKPETPPMIGPIKFSGLKARENDMCKLVIKELKKITKEGYYNGLAYPQELRKSL